jgi:hypothetical protein
MRIARAGIAAALAAGLVGVVMERARFGSSEEAMVARIQDELRDELDAAAETLGTIAARITATPEQLRVASRDPAMARALFDQASAALEDQEAGRTGVTVYGADTTPIAWAGRVFDVPRARLEASSSLFVSPGAIGPRLIRIQPLVDRAATGRGVALPAGTIVVEQSLARVEGRADQPDTFVLSTSLVPVTLRALVGTTPPRRDHYVFPVSSRNGSLLAEAEVSRANLAEARAQWRRNTWAGAITVLGLTLLLCAGPIADARLRTTDVQTFLAQTLALAATVVGALALLLFAVRNVAGSASPTSPAGLLLIADGPRLVTTLRRPFDWIGFSLISVSLLCFTYVFSQGSRWNWFDESRILWLTAIGAATLLAFLGQQVMAKGHGLLDFTLFRSEDFCFAFIVSFVAGAALFGSAFLIPSFAVSVLAFRPTDAGLLLLASGGLFVGREAGECQKEYQWATNHPESFIVRCILPRSNIA